MTPPLARGVLAALALALASQASPVRAANIFSPGELSRPHAALSGLESCTRCHPAGERLAQGKCFECHQELLPRFTRGEGFHGRIAQGERDCWLCHREHLGRDAPLIDWGEGGAKAFDHARTGVKLSGKHAVVACERCHDPALVKDPRLAPLLAAARAKGRRSYLGAPPITACASCHFDEHRGQLGQECQRCHDDSGWTPARGFEHARTAYPLTGRHLQVACARCHATVNAAARANGAVTAPVNAQGFVRYRPVAFASCASCHEDVHQGRLGADCARCHTTAGWKEIAAAAGMADRAFHERTRYPLRGAHAAVACASCHAPRGPPAIYRGLAFGSCTDCHRDVHQGRLGADCTRCHAVESWEQLAGAAGGAAGRAFHDETRYPLRGAHAAVACASCHGPHPGEPQRLRGLAFGACTDCHADAHVGQLSARGGPAEAACDRCHDLQSFRPARFGLEEHQQLVYPLLGAHRVVACSACHPSDPAMAERAAGELRPALVRQDRPVRVSPVVFTVKGSLVRCETCHADPHAGQLQRDGGCAACHEVASFRQVRFDHAKESRFPLVGRHAEAACDACHRPEGPAVPDPAGASPRSAASPAAVVRYKPLPLSCSGCHADPHAGQLAGSCDRCHAADAASWKELRFQHAPPFTGYALTGRHARVACEKCHQPVEVAPGVRVRRYKPLPRACEGCHADFHKGAFQGFEPDRRRP